MNFSGFVAYRASDYCLVSSNTFPFIHIRFRNRCPHFRSVALLPFSYRDANGYEKKQNSILFERLNGTGELKAMENVILRKLRNSYG